jgi:hypothetical protein
MHSRNERLGAGASCTRVVRPGRTVGRYTCNPRDRSVLRATLEPKCGASVLWQIYYGYWETVCTSTISALRMGFRDVCSPYSTNVMPAVDASLKLRLGGKTGCAIVASTTLLEINPADARSAATRLQGRTKPARPSISLCLMEKQTIANRIDPVFRSCTFGLPTKVSACLPKSVGTREGPPRLHPATRPRGPMYSPQGEMSKVSRSLQPTVHNRDAAPGS